MVVIPASSRAGVIEPFAARPLDTLIIDRQPLFLEALGSLLSSPKLSSHVMTASRSDVAMEMVRDVRVDLVCCELAAEPISGVEVARMLGEGDCSVPVILLGDAGDEPQLASALTANVAGMFTKSAEPDEFLAGVKAVLAGHRAIGSTVIRHLLAGYAPNSHGRTRFDALSSTELEILSMIGQAQSIPSIAASRGISCKTVRNHLARIYRKLELHGRTEAMLWATRMGLTGS